MKLTAAQMPRDHVVDLPAVPETAIIAAAIAVPSNFMNVICVTSGIGVSSVQQ